MDIQVASNFERLLYFILDGDTARVRDVMNSFRKEGRYCFENLAVEGFSSSSVSDSEIPEIIRSVNREYGYWVDPHTACGFKDLPRMKNISYWRLRTRPSFRICTKMQGWKSQPLRFSINSLKKPRLNTPHPFLHLRFEPLSKRIPRQRE